MKICRICKESKSEDAFSIASSGKSNVNYRRPKFSYRSECKACTAISAKAWRAKHKAYRGSGLYSKLTAEERRLTSAISAKLIDAKTRIKKHALAPSDLDKAYLIELYHKQGGKCVLSGSDLLLTPKQMNSLSLDKIDPNRSYVKGNVQWLCWAVNRAKGEMQTDTFLDMCRRITGKCNDYPEREYIQVDGSAQPQEIG